MGLDESFKALYISKRDEFKAALLASNEQNKMYGPYLCSPGSDYWESKIKIVFVGQETNGWPIIDSVESQMQVYIGFGLGIKYRSSPFWNVIRKIELALNGKHYTCASLNLNRFDVNKKAPKGEYLAINETLDHILLAEIELLQPDIVVFFTGPNYDRRVTQLFNTSLSEVDGFTKRQFAEIKLAEKPYRVFRTYHPRSLRMGKLEARAIEKIVSVFRV